MLQADRRDGSGWPAGVNSFAVHAFLTGWRSTVFIFSGATLRGSLR
jgi:hypothetical protein